MSSNKRRSHPGDGAADDNDPDLDLAVHPSDSDNPSKKFRLHHGVENAQNEAYAFVSSTGHLVLHQVSCSQDPPHHEQHSHLTWYLDRPRLYEGDNHKAPLRGMRQIANAYSLLESLTNIAFVVIKIYDCVAYHGMPEILSKFKSITCTDLAGMPTLIPIALQTSLNQALLDVLVADKHHARPTKELIDPKFCSSDFVAAMELVQHMDDDFRGHLHRWDSPDNLTAPFLQFYHARRYLRDACNRLDSFSSMQLNTILSYLDVNFGAEYDEADSLFQRGYFTESHFQKLFAPGDVVVIKEDGCDRAMHVTRVDLSLKGTLKANGLSRAKLDQNDPDQGNKGRKEENKVCLYFLTLSCI